MDIKSGLKQVVVGAALAISAFGLPIIGCDQARNLVQPIDNTAIQTTGQSDFSIKVKPVGDTYETTISFTNITAFDTDGNLLPGVTVTDIVLNTPKVPDIPKPDGKWDWLEDVISKNAELKPGYNCDNNTTLFGYDDANKYNADGGFVADWHKHFDGMLWTHKHKYWSKDHYHHHGRLVEAISNVSDQELDKEHTHTIFLQHSHKHRSVDELRLLKPPQPFHNHKCE